MIEEPQEPMLIKRR